MQAAATRALWAAGAAGVLCLAAWWLARPAPLPAAPVQHTPPRALQAPAAAAREQAAAEQAAPPPQPAVAGPRLNPTTLALQPGARPMFRADAQGRLVHDEHTRLQVEKLLALHDAAEVQRIVEAESTGLPAAALAQARELVERFEAWQTAQRLAFAPGVAPQVPEEGLAQLQALQALRASHFGAERAQAMFGEEDAVTRRLLQLMQQETDTRLSMEERAMRAQVRYDQERGVRARP